MGRRLGKNQRQHRIGQLLADNAVTSQTQLVDLLDSEGIESTQATVSRDLEEMGAIKVRIPGGDTVYGVPEDPSEHHVPSDILRRVLGDWVVEVNRSGDLLVVRTPPGSAHVVASAIDRTGLEDLVGTVAGDDTLILVIAHGRGAAAQTNLCELAGL
jgi:transcriptional regulator of arginine metabolism